MPSKASAVVAVALVMGLALPHPLAAQGPATDPRTLSERLRFFRLDETWTKTEAERSSDIARLADSLDQRLFALVFYALPPRTLADDFRRFLQTAERARVDQQIGSGTAATKTGLTTLLGLALESGAVSQTVDQQTATLRANADGLLRFLSNQEVIPTCPGGDEGCSRSSFLKDVDLATTFTIGNGGTKTLEGTSPTSGAPVRFSALLDSQRFTSLTARYAVQNSRDVRSPEYRQKWAETIQANAGPLGALGASLLTYIQEVVERVQTRDASGNLAKGTPTEYSLWLAATGPKLTAATSKTDAEQILSAQLDDLLARMRRLDPEFDVKLAALSDAYLRYLAVRRDLAATLVTDPALTLEYTYAKPPLEPKLHIVKAAWAFSPGNREGTPTLTPGAPGFRPRIANPGTITFNASLAYFQDPQPTNLSAGTSHWKNAQLAVQFDRPLGPGDGAARLSIGAYYQYQFSPGIIVVPGTATFLAGTSIPLSDAGRQVLSEEGSVFATQALLTLRLGDSGLKVPIGVSWANRTELVTGNDVRGHIGFTFDTTPLLLVSGLR